MEVELDFTKTINENINEKYKKLKRLKEKLREIEKKLKETPRYVAKKVKVKRKKEWYEKFHYFFTDGGKLVLAGRDATQNEILMKKYLEDSDLFFHADIQGGAFAILKEGKKASEEEKMQAAQFAACFSKAWKFGYAEVDVFAGKKEQIRKHEHGMYLPKGAFIIEGERIWFKHVKLELKVGKENEIVVILPSTCKRKLEGEICLVPGKKEKGEIARMLAKKYGVEMEEILHILPDGKISISTSERETSSKDVAR